jgi:DNA repair protein RecN (Recombination protein N)
VLRELRIENLLLIERAELRFGQGLNAITGETGAGKTVLAHSLDLLMGGKARAQIVRPGAGEAWVEGAFDIPDGLLEEPELGELSERLPEGTEEIVLGRRVSASGRTGAFVAGRSASAADLRLLGGRLLAFYGQHEHRKLTISSAQLEILDGFAGSGHLETRRSYRAEHRHCARLEGELSDLRERDGARERDLDLFRYELAEIDAAAPDASEEAELGAERERLRHAEGLRLAATEALGAIAGSSDDEGGAAGLLAGAQMATQGVAGVDAGLDERVRRIDSVAVELGDLATEMRAYLDRIEADPGRLALVEERLEAIDRLKRKHGGSIESVLEHAERCRAEIDQLENAEGRTAEIEIELAATQGRRAAAAELLTRARSKAAKTLESRVAKELEHLAMPGARLEVLLEPHPDGFGPGGGEAVELRVATNPGIDPAPLREAASGGELSRVMLALCGLTEAAGAGTLVFDEIDAGVGGKTAGIVGERLRALGGGRQVICITHLPQVASLASEHFRIEKTVSGGETRATVERVDGDELVAEIARMLGGGDAAADDAASRHARELLEAA